MRAKPPHHHRVSMQQRPRPTSTRLRPAGPSRNNISASTPRAHQTICAEWPAAPAIASHPTIATSGSLMRVTKLNSGERWG